MEKVVFTNKLVLEEETHKIVVAREFNKDTTMLENIIDVFVDYLLACGYNMEAIRDWVKVK